jgi:hypothetical protein
MDLDLDIRTKGRATIPLTVRTVRPLCEADVAMLASETGTKTSAVKRLSDRHHALARAIASGMPPGEAAIMCGYALSRVSILQADPAFRELLAFYREEKDRAFRSVQDKLAGMASDVLDELQTRIEDEPEKLTITQMLQIVTMAADRTGNGPSSTQNVNVNEGLARRLEAARQRVEDRRAKIIEGAVGPATQ